MVLAGGRSRRFGGVDKTRLPLAGRSLLQRSLDVLAEVTPVQLLVGGASRYGRDAVPDRFPGAGPLGAILTALEAIDSSHALVLAADLPFISSRLLLDVQCAGADTAVAIVQHEDARLALCLSIARDARHVLRDAFDAGARAIRDMERLLPCVRVTAHESAGVGELWNVNDPLTYGRALAMTEHD